MHKNEIDFLVELFTPKYREQVLGLLKQLWQNVKPEQYDAYFRWKYEENPYTKSPLIIICICGETVVGVLGHMVQSIMVNGSQYNVCIPVDGIVHPEYRMYGVYSRMLREGIRQLHMLNDTYDFKFFFNASSNSASAPGLVKLGWQALAPRRYFTKFSVINILLRRKSYCLTQNVEFALSYRGSDHRLSITSELRIEEIERIHAARADKVHVAHDLKYLLWRYSYNQQNYRYAYLYSGHKPVAYMVLNCGTSMQSSIEEYGFTDYESLYLLITKTMKLLSLKVLRLFVTAISKEEKSALNKAGLYAESKILLQMIKKKVRTPVYIKNFNGEGSAKDYFLNGVDCLDGSNWRLFHADIL